MGRGSPSRDRNYNIFNRDDNMDVYVMNADGSGMKNITDHSSHDAFPIGRRTGRRLRSIRRETATARSTPWRLMGQTSSELLIRGAWTSRLAGRRTASGSASFQGVTVTSEIYTVDPDGGDMHRVTHSQGNELSPEWSPDGHESPSNLIATGTVRCTSRTRTVRIR
jgi:TolB protein